MKSTRTSLPPAYAARTLPRPAQPNRPANLGPRTPFHRRESFVHRSITLLFALAVVLATIAPNVLAQGYDCTAQSDVVVADCEALVALYDATDGDNWTDNTNWLTGERVSTWYGVTVEGGRVRMVLLNGNGLSGTLPAELEQLTSLEVLWLGQNSLSGSIPPDLGQLSVLRQLSLYRNELTGTIPSQLGELTKLTDLRLYSNQLTGVIPEDLGQLPVVQWIDLGDNQLTGIIPEALTGLTNLRHLALYSNQLAGNLPAGLSQLGKLARLDLTRNQLAGNIPSELGQLPVLEYLSLSENQFSGAIPGPLAQLTNLEILDLSSNDLTGTMPSELAQLTSLIWLFLYDNNLTGAIPSSFTNLTALELFYFHTTNLCVPQDASFQSWLSGLSNVQSTGVMCTANEATATISTGQTGSIGMATAGITLELTDPSGTDGSLTAQRHQEEAANNDDLAVGVTVETSDGPVTPTTVSPDRHWTITAAGLTDFAVDVCLDVTGLPGASDFSTLAVVKREDAGSSWMPLNSTYEPSDSTDYICTSDVSSFSQFGIASDEQNALPVELTSFEAVLEGEDILLSWHTASEANNAGFEIQHSREADTWDPLAFVEGHGTTSEPQAYTYRTSDLAPGRHLFRLKQVDYDGAATYSSEVEVSVEMTERFVLEPAYPNPFNPQATIRFAVREAVPVQVALYDVLGREIRMLYTGIPASGQMLPVRIDGSDLPSGTYFVRLTGEGMTATRQVVLLK